MDDQDLLGLIRAQFALDWDGIHGPRHWRRVAQTGLRLAEATGADRRVIELFALLHDSRRFSNGDDPEHGARAADFVRDLAGRVFQLDGSRLELLRTACRFHSDGLKDGDITVLTCWDADRLDLGRVGIRPRAEYLCTAPARDPAFIQWAYRRSISRDGRALG